MIWNLTAVILTFCAGFIAGHARCAWRHHERHDSETLDRLARIVLDAHERDTYRTPDELLRYVVGNPPYGSGYEPEDSTAFDN